MRVYLESENVITSLGFSVDENFKAMAEGISGIGICNDNNISETNFPASLIDKYRLNSEFPKTNLAGFTIFEKLIILSAHKALSVSLVDPAHPRTVFILSTTKGNVDLLRGIGKKADIGQLYLWHSAELLRHHFHNPNKAIVISNGCVSGLVAMIIGQRLIRNGDFDHAIVVGADIISKFIVSGFQSFLMLSSTPCKPFDRERDGLTLGEGAGTVILTNQRPAHKKQVVEMVSGVSANDANHISGPSRTGEGLYSALKRTLMNFIEEPGFISAHGTATPYNDDMESVAITRAGLQHVPVNSMKGYFGHTMGAVGIIESVIGAYSLINNLVLKTLGLQNPGLVQPINTITENVNIQLQTFVKTTSGFGGCNAVALFKKHE